MRTSSPAERLAKDAFLLAACIIISYVESLVPYAAFIPLPGFKPGLANIAVMFAFFTVGRTDAALILAVKVTVIALLFGSPTSFVFSAAGGTLMFAAMLVTQRFYRKGQASLPGVSVLCAAAHNTGQIAAASVMLSDTGVFAYLPWLLLASVPCGIVTGAVASLVISYMRAWKIK